MKPDRRESEKEPTAHTQDTTSVDGESRTQNETQEQQTNKLVRKSLKKNVNRTLKRKKSGETINDPSVDLKGTPSQEKLMMNKPPRPEIAPTNEKVYLKSEDVKDAPTDNDPSEALSSTPANKVLNKSATTEALEEKHSAEKPQVPVKNDIEQSTPAKDTNKQESSADQDVKFNFKPEKTGDEKLKKDNKEKACSDGEAKTKTVTRKKAVPKKEKTTTKRRNKTKKEKKAPRKIDAPLEEITAPDAEPELMNIKNTKATTPSSQDPKSKTTTTQKDSQRRQKDLAKPHMAFINAVMNKTKFWARKSDCVLEPTKEMLAKPCVPADYGEQSDFFPSLFFTAEEKAIRMKNPGAKTEEVFVGRRPFWVVRKKSDTFPKKTKVQLHGKLKQYLDGGMKDEAVPKRRNFSDPLKCSLDELTSVDKEFKVEQDTVEKTLMINTIRSTVYFEVAKMGTHKDRLMDRNSQKIHEKLITFKTPVMINTYNRKDRPCVARRKKKRNFTLKEYESGVKKGAKKKKSKSTSTNSISAK